MKVDLGIWGRLTQVVIALLLIAGIAAVGVWYLPLIQRNERMRKQIFRLEQQVKAEEETARQLKQSFDSLRNDPKAVERLAREKLGYARPGETVVRFQPPPTNAAVRPLP
jgi:cell division protein FtsB